MARQRFVNHPEHPRQFVKPSVTLKVLCDVGRIFDARKKVIVFRPRKTSRTIFITFNKLFNPGVTRVRFVRWRRAGGVGLRGICSGIRISGVEGFCDVISRGGTDRGDLLRLILQIPKSTRPFESRMSPGVGEWGGHWKQRCQVTNAHFLAKFSQLLMHICVHAVTKTKVWCCSSGTETDWVY